MTAQLELFQPSQLIGPVSLPRAAQPEEKSLVKLRPYQVDALDAINDNRVVEGYNRQLLHLATGGGKTLVSAVAMQRLGRPVLAMMHRIELATQFIATCRMVWPEADVGLVQGENNQVGRQITVALVQTLSSERRFKEAFPAHKLKVPHFLWTDESHHATGSTYQYVYNQFGLLLPGGRHFHLGVTATPKRADGKGLADIYDIIAYSWSIKSGITQGYLCDLRGYTLAFANEDMAEVITTAGDYNQGQLDKAVRKIARNEAIVECWWDKAHLGDGEYRQTIVFCVTVDHAREVAATFAKAGVNSDVVYGDLPDDQRKAVLNKFSSGKTRVLCNVGVLTEGYDHPPTSCIVMARPTKSQGLYIQCAGRGTRLYPGKKDCLILDVAEVASKNSLNAPVTLGKALGLVESDGKAQKEIKSVAEQLKMKMPGLGTSTPIEGMDTQGGKEFNPFADPFASSELVGFRWHQGESGLTLSLPKDKYDDPKWLVIKRDPRTWLFDVVQVTRYNAGENSRGFNSYKTKEEFVNKNQFPSEELAAAWAGDYAKKERPGITKLQSKDAAWRQDQAAGVTPAQRDMLAKLYKKGLPAGFNDASLTKVQASELIDVATSKRWARVTIERPIGDMEFI